MFVGNSGGRGKGTETIAVRIDGPLQCQGFWQSVEPTHYAGPVAHCLQTPLHTFLGGKLAAARGCKKIKGSPLPMAWCRTFFRH